MSEIATGILDLKAVSGHLDARYGAGPTKVWYQRPEYFRDGGMGYAWLQMRGMLPAIGDLGRSHVCVGAVDETDLEEIYSLFQAHRWSPKGEARPLIERLGLRHTSMVVGDVIEHPAGFFLVDGLGFKRLLWRGGVPV